MKRVKHVLVLMLTLAACCSYAQEVERVDLSYLIEKAANGFWEIRGDARERAPRSRQAPAGQCAAATIS
jgi:hypothetical protein